MTGRSTVPFIGIVLASAVLGACSAERERQWAKPGADYTIAEFTRDRDACTKSGVLDEQCLKGRGWVPLTGDREKDVPPPVKQGVGPRGPRY